MYSSKTNRITSKPSTNRDWSRDDDNFSLRGNGDDQYALFKTSSQTLMRAKDDGLGRNVYGKSQTDATSSKGRINLEGAKQIVEFMYDCWKKSRLCDTIIQVSSGNVEVHKVVLAAHSTQLAQKFDAFPMGDIISIDLSDYPEDIVMELLRFMYTTELNMNLSNVALLFCVAQELQVEYVIDRAMRFLDNINVDNAIFLYLTCSQINLTEQARVIEDFICNSLLKVVRSPGFLNLPYEKLTVFLDNWGDAFPSELELFLAIMLWIDYDRQSRLQLSPTLLKRVKLNLISPEDLTCKVEKYQHIFENLECHHMLYNAMKYHALKAAGQPDGNINCNAGSSNIIHPTQTLPLCECANVPQGLTTTTSQEITCQSKTDSSPSFRAEKQDTSIKCRSISDRVSSCRAVVYEQETTRNDQPIESRIIYKDQPIERRSCKDQPIERRECKEGPIERHTCKDEPIERSSGKNQPIKRRVCKDQPIERRFCECGGCQQPASEAEVKKEKTSSSNQQQKPTQETNYNINRNPADGVESDQDSPFGSSTPKNPVNATTICKNSTSRKEKMIAESDDAHISSTTTPRATMPDKKPTKSTLKSNSGGHHREPSPPSRSRQRLGRVQAAEPTRHGGRKSQERKEKRRNKVIAEHDSESSVLVPPSSDLEVERTRVLAVGGIDLHKPISSKPGRRLYVYSPGGTSWEHLASLKDAVHHHGLAIIGHMVYIIGGIVSKHSRAEQIAGKATKAVLALNTDTMQWMKLASMNRARAYLSTAATHECIFAVGGEDEQCSKLNSIEKYDVQYNKWQHLTTLRQGAKLGTAAAVYRSCLYIVGGYVMESNGSPVCADVECFHLHKLRWINKRPLSMARCHSNLVVCSDRLYLLGGRAWDMHLGILSSISTIEVYDELSDVWGKVTCMRTQRHDFGCCAVGNLIYVVGGMHSPDQRCLNSVECYDTTARGWLSVPTLPQPVTGLALAAF